MSWERSHSSKQAINLLTNSSLNKYIIVISRLLELRLPQPNVEVCVSSRIHQGRKKVFMAKTHRGQRSRESREIHAARKYCIENSRYDLLKKESTYLGTQDECEKAVLTAVRDIREDILPETPQGMVISAPNYDAFLEM